MIWTIALWMAMQGQAHAPCELHNAVLGGNAGTNCAITLDDPGIVPQKNYMMPPNLMESVTPNAPAEHVFEIRTKREDHGKAYDAQTHEWTTNCKSEDLVQFTPEEREAHCVRITRELWLNDKRLGIIKGLD